MQSRPQRVRATVQVGLMRALCNQPLPSRSPGIVIWVAAGVHYPGTLREDSFAMKSGVAVYGGFDGTETELSERDWFANPTVLSGDIDHNDTNKDADGIVTNVSGIVGANAYHVLVGSGADQTAVFDGFIINAGQADGTTLYHNQGGGVYLTLGNPTLNNLVISANTTNNQGAGLYNDRSTATLSNIAFRGNSATGSGHHGGGIFNHAGSPTLSNVLFSGNYAYHAGGFFTDGGDPTLINATFSGNRGDNYATMHVGGGTPTLVNAIFWGNNSTIGGARATVTYSIIQGGYPGAGNLDVDPLFVDERSYNDAPTTAGDYRPRYGSVTADIGLNDPVVTVLDLDGNPRIADGDGDSLDEVDLGAYEQLPGVCGDEGMLFVNHAASGANTGLTWDDAFTDLQTALATARNCEVWVAKGAYLPTDTTDRTQAFLLRSGVQVYGGFDGTETLLSERDWFANPTVLSGDIDGNDTTKDADGIVTNVSGIVGANAYHVLVGSGADQTAVFDGFIINAGQADGTTLYHNQGGGVYLTLGNPTLNNLVISANTTNSQGAGLYNDRSTATLSNIAFRGNSVTGSGHHGGGMFNHAGSPTLSNVLFSGNYAYHAGGLFTDGGDPTLINVTFSGNRGDNYATMHVGGGTPTLVNAIFWGNNSTIGGLGATVTYSIIQGGYPGAGNLDVDPLFVDERSYNDAPTTAGDYRLRYGSVTADIGLNTPVVTVLDLDGNPRIADGDGDSLDEVDLGAYEQLPGVCGDEGMLFVNHAASGANTGLTWDDAFTDLQTALATARNCEVWVAKGVYLPTDTTDRTQAFLLRSGVQVYGGFDGTETELSERDWFANPTVLSGDIDGNDTNKDADGIVTNVSGIVGANAYHVLVGSGADQTAVFDGFIINAGQADGTTLYHNQGGGVYLTLGNPTLNNLVISANTTNSQGGGLYNDRSTATLSNIALRGNSATGSGHIGGGMFNHAGSPTLSNVLFSGNYAYHAGGLFTDGGDPNLVNVTFSGNRGVEYAVMHVGGGTPTLVNAIFWGNNSTIGGLGATVTYSIIQGGYTGAGNLDVDPLFVDERSYTEAPTTAGDYRPRYGSVTTDIGLNTPVVTALDLDGNPRIADGDGDGLDEVDLGAYEQLPGVCGDEGMLFVNHAASGANTGLTWDDAFTDLQTALATARNCEVWVAKGVYLPTDTTDRTQAFLLRSGVQVYGGFDGTETELSERDWFANPTVLSGDIDGNDTNKDADGIVTNVSGIVGANAYHVLVGSGADQTAVFDGFIINAGQADGTTLYHNQGGGVYLTLGNPTLNNLVISANTTNSQGAGLYNDRSTATLSNIAFRGNSATGSGHHRWRDVQSCRQPDPLQRALQRQLCLSCWWPLYRWRRSNPDQRHLQRQPWRSTMLLCMLGVAHPPWSMPSSGATIRPSGGSVLP